MCIIIGMHNQLFRDKYKIKSLRLPDWDYSSNGAYYITICTRNRKCLFGKIVDGKQHGLFEFIRGFKTFSSRKINKIQDSFYFQWQRDYFEHVIRNKNELNRIREYIINNPSKWEINLS